MSRRWYPIIFSPTNRVAKLLTTLVATLLITSQPSAETLVYGVLMKDLHNPYWQAMQLGLKEGTAEAEAEYFLQSTSQEQTAAQQLDICHQMLDRKPNVLMASPIDSNTLKPCFSRAKKLDIPVINLDGAPHSDSGSESGSESGIAINVTSDNSNAGTIAAQHTASQIDTSTDNIVLILTGSTNDNVATLRADAFKQSLKEIAPDLQQVTAVGAGDDVNAIDIAVEQIKNHVNLKVIFAANSALTQAATDAVNATGKNNIMVIGVDASPQTIQSIAQGKLHSAVVKHPFLTGKQTVAVVVKLLEGANINEDINTPNAVLTKALIDMGADSLIKDTW